MSKISASFEEAAAYTLAAWPADQRAGAAVLWLHADHVEVLHAAKRSGLERGLASGNHRLSEVRVPDQVMLNPASRTGDWLPRLVAAQPEAEVVVLDKA